MGGSMYMGPRGREKFVPAPATGGEFTPVGWSGSSKFLGGGATVKRSKASHMEYSMTWDMKPRDELRPITDMYSGKRGPGLIYFIDPMAADKNVLPEMWAFPAQACYDAMPIAGSGNVRPKLVNTSYNELDYPVESAQYTVTATTTVKSLYVPVPPGYVAWVGIHGEPDSFGLLKLTAIPRDGTVPTIIRPIGLLPSDRVRVNTSVDGDVYGGVELALSADTLAVTNTTLSPSFETATASTVIRRTNQATVPAGTSAWTGRWFGTGGAGTHTYLTGSGIPDGPDTYVRKTWTVAGPPGDTGLNAQTLIPAVVGAVYTLSGWMRTSDAGRNGHIYVTWNDAGAAQISSSTGAATTLTDNWQRISATFTAPAGAIQMGVILEVDTGATWAVDSTLDGSGLLIEETSVLQKYLDGSTAPTNDSTFVWTGTANLSKSTQLSPTPLNASSNTSAITYRSSPPIGAGLYSATHRRTSTAAFRADFRQPYTASQTYTLLFRASCSVASGFTINLRPSVAANTGQAQIADIQIGPTVTDYRFTFVAPVTAAQSTSAVAFLAGAGPQWPVGETLTIDNAMMVTGVYDGPYIDGDTAGSAWTGIAHESTSTRTWSTATLTGLVMQVLPAGVVPGEGDFISGQGNSGCEFADAPSVVAYSAVLDKVGMAAKLIEVGSWRP